jgi:ribosomal protein L11 methyltransferase
VNPYRAYHFSVFPAEKLELVSAWLTSFPYESFEQTEKSIHAYVPLSEVDKIDVDACLSIPFDGVEVTLHTEDIAGQNWNAVWEENFHPILVGDWTIRASFHPPATTQYEIVIDPKMSFGTGHHATTQLMLQALISLDLTDKSVLDMGTGTGVLAIAAKKLGAKNVLGLDIEDWCIANAKENASKNGISDILFTLESLPSLALHRQELIVANINRNVLLDHLPEYAKLLAKGGVLLLSGFHQEDVAILTELAQKCGLLPAGQFSMFGWVCLKFIN